MRVVLGFCFLLVSAVAFGQNWSGVYECLVDKDGYRVKMDAEFQKNGDEYTGKLKAVGNVSFNIEIWGMDNGGYVDFYYGSGSDEIFSVPNVHLFSISGTPAAPSTSFGTGLYDEVKFVDLSTGFVQKGKLPEVKNSTAQPRVIPKPRTSPSTTTTTTKTDVSNKSKGELLLGKWMGEPATATTKYFDYIFKNDGTGERGFDAFFWDLDGDAISVKWIELIPKSRYDQIMGQAEGVQYMEDHMVVSTPSRSYKLVIADVGYGILGKTEELKISRVDGETLTLVARDDMGKAVMTYHKRK